MMVYLAYVLIVLHVLLGAFQQETSYATLGLLLVGFVMVSGLHLTAAIRETAKDRAKSLEDDTGWIKLCKPEAIGEDRARIFTIGKERVAVFKYEGKLSAIYNVCKHQGGPLGEGKIIDGCVTCPWHGYQYLPQNGQSPPPFTEKIATYRLKLQDGEVYIDPQPRPEGTEITPVIL